MSRLFQRSGRAESADAIAGEQVRHSPTVAPYLRVCCWPYQDRLSYICYMALMQAHQGPPFYGPLLASACNVLYSR